MDVNLSNADAFFFGENATDESGTAVAGLGDVNGDGSDDFVIGSPYNNMNNVGRTYLFLSPAEESSDEKDSDDDDDDDGELVIPFGNAYLIFTIGAMVALTIVQKRKKK